MIRKLITIIVFVLIAYGIWYYFDKDSAKVYLPDYFGEEKADQVVFGVGDFISGTWNAVFDYVVENIWDKIKGEVGDKIGESVADMIKGEEPAEAN